MVDSTTIFFLKKLKKEPGMKELEKLKQITTSTILMGRDFQKKITRYRQIAYVLFFVDIFLVPFVFICYIAQPGAVINNMLELIFCWILISLVSATAVVYIEDKKVPNMTICLLKTA